MRPPPAHPNTQPPRVTVRGCNGRVVRAMDYNGLDGVLTVTVIWTGVRMSDGRMRNGLRGTRLP
jgi:hypothetical protein